MEGYFGKVLYIDLSSRSYWVEDIDEEIFRTYLGGKGLGIYYLLHTIKSKIDPLSAENCIVIATGCATGSGIWGCSRYSLFSLSPLTGLFAESYAGGEVSDRLAETGFDVIIIKGSSHDPVWIEISSNGVAFHEAHKLWGLDTYSTHNSIINWLKENRKGFNRFGVVCIGPAGENLVRFSVVENNYWRSAGRCGIGAVFGSKKIKAISFAGNMRKKFNNREKIFSFNRQILEIGKRDPGAIAYRKFGTPMMVDIINEIGAFPTKYWKKGRADHRNLINADALHNRCEVKPHACPHCFLACGRMSKVKSGPYKGLVIEGPEYETIYAFGGLCLIQNIEEIIYLNDLCDKLGLDTISTGNIISFAIEASHMKKIDYKLDYGDVDGISGLIKDIAYKRDLGKILSQGIVYAAKEFGLEDFAIHVKGMEPAGYDPRIFKGMALSYATSDRGACHLRTTFYKAELSGISPPDKIEGKAEILIEWEDRLIIMDTLILCRFFRDLYPWERLQQIVFLTTGLDLTKQGLRSIAQNIKNNIRLFNEKQGFKEDQDALPKRFFKEPLPETNQRLLEKDFVVMLKDYYRLRGWKL